MFSKIPNEISIMIFRCFFDALSACDFSYLRFFDRDVKDLVNNVKNLRLVSKRSNDLIALCICDLYGSILKIRIAREKNVWKDLVNSCLVSCLMIDDELELKDRNMCINNTYVGSVKDALRCVGLGNVFIGRYWFLRSGREMYRKSLIKDYVMSNKQFMNGEGYKKRKFRKFYKKHLSSYYEYKPRSIKRIDRSSEHPVIDLVRKMYK
jgi:hypothetical protein